MKYKLFFLFYLFLKLVLFGQNQANIWYFGVHAGLDFVTSPPTLLNYTNNAIWTQESSACMSDALGNILFYTDSDTIWNKQHQLMANGGGLMGLATISQAALIVKQPNNNHLYYVFHIGNPPVPTNTFELRYSIVDMSLAAGMGSVTSKNNLLFNSTCGKLNASLHCNGQDVWVMSHDWNSNQFRAYLLTSSGLSLTPVISAIGPTLTGPNNNVGIGYMKFSPNGSKLGMAHSGLFNFEVYDFDNATGIVSNPLQLNAAIANPLTYGFEFSPDGTIAYGTGKLGTVLYQWNLCAGSASAIVTSEYTISTPQQVLPLQVAPDGKIYFTNLNDNSLGVINNPNASGPACGYSSFVVSYSPAFAYEGLPNFMSNYFFKPAPISISNSINCQRVEFAINSAGCAAAGYSVHSMQWDFNDPASGAANTSTLSNPVHQFSAPGTYTTQVIVYYKCRADTATQVVTVNALSPTLTVSGSYTICKGATATFSATGANTFSWSIGGTTNTIALTPSITTNYILMGTNTANTCTNEVNFTLQVISPTLTVSGSNSICTGEKTTFTVSGANAYNWSNNVSTNTVLLSPTLTTSYAVTGTNTANSCTNQVTFTVNVSKCLSLKEGSSENALVLIYPNPNTGVFTTELANAAELNITDTTGKLIYRQQLPAGKTELNLSNYSKGLYFLGLGNTTNIKKVKLILE